MVFCNDFDACTEFCIISLYILPYIYTHIQTLFDKCIGTFHNSLCFSKNYVFDIEQT